MVEIPFEKSFASHPKSKFWNQSKNSDLTPRDVALNSGKKFWFDCDKCPHSFGATLDNVNGKDRWCPYCATSNGKLCEDDDCNMCYEKSFASHPKSKFWKQSKNGDLTPRQLKLGSEKKFWFDCDKCPHSFETALDGVNGGTWCPYCSIPCKKFCEDDDCNMCYGNTFVSHHRYEFWDWASTKNEGLNPRQIAFCSGRKFWFICEKGHSFDIGLNKVNSGRWCPHCVNKTETKLLEFLNKIYDVKRQAKFEWCKNQKNNYLPFDFIVNGMIIIELDGRQHFIQISNWLSPEKTQENDRYKMKQAFKNDKHIIRILQEDVFNDKNDWENKLIEAIDKLKGITKPELICIGDNEVYNQYMVEFNNNA